MSDTALVPTRQDIKIVDPGILAKLETYEDYLSFYIQLDEAETEYSWLKADTLLQMTEKLGSNSLESLAKDIGKPPTTVVNYVRTAKAFPQEQRDPGVSFSHHYQASFADSFDDKTKEFNGEKRFEWLQKASEGHLSTRALAEEIRHQKIETMVEVLICVHCGTNKETKEYVLFSPEKKKQADRFILCDKCHTETLAFVHGIKT